MIVTGAIGDYGPAVTVRPSVTSHWRATRTCSFHLSVTAAIPVVAGSGTGSYRGITGAST